MASETASAFARRMARQAFDAGLRAAGQPPAERDRRRADAETYTDSMLASAIDSEVERRVVDRRRAAGHRGPGRRLAPGGRAARCRRTPHRRRRTAAGDRECRPGRPRERHRRPRPPGRGHA